MALKSLDEALTIAKRRKVRPTALDTAGIRAAWSRDFRRRSVFSAATTHAGYLQVLSKTVQQLIDGRDASGKTFTRADARARLRFALQSLGYSPDKGFGLPADADIPPATPGSIRDLSSTRRLNLILETQLGLLFGAGRRQREMEPERMKAFPAWQLVRVGAVETPRGFKRGRDGALEDDAENSWKARWIAVQSGQADADTLMAAKWSETWQRLGDSDKFQDGLDSQNPPYAFQSGMGWREVTRERAERVLGKLRLPKRLQPAVELPSAAVSLEVLPPAAAERIKRVFKAVEKRGKLTVESAMQTILKRQKAAETERAVKDAAP